MENPSIVLSTHMGGLQLPVPHICRDPICKSKIKFRDPEVRIHQHRYSMLMQFRLKCIVIYPHYITGAEFLDSEMAGPRQDLKGFTRTVHPSSISMKL